MLKYILLGFLQYGSMSGYDIKARMDESIAHFWHAHHSQIYSTLRRMDDNDLVSSEMVDDDGREKRLYALTEAGRAELDTWLNQSLTEPSAVKEELLVRLFFSGRRDPLAVLTELHMQRQLHQQKLDHYRTIQPERLLHSDEPVSQQDIQQEALYWDATLTFGKRFEEMYIAWLDDMIEKVKEQASMR